MSGYSDRDAVIVGAVRTPVGKGKATGALHDVGAGIARESTDAVLDVGSLECQHHRAIGIGVQAGAQAGRDRLPPMRIVDSAAAAAATARQFRYGSG